MENNNQNTGSGLQAQIDELTNRTNTIEDAILNSITNSNDVFGNCLDIISGKIKGDKVNAYMTLETLLDSGTLSEKQKSTAMKFIYNGKKKNEFSKSIFGGMPKEAKDLVISDIHIFCNLLTKYICNKEYMRTIEMFNLMEIFLLMMDYDKNGFLPKSFKHRYYLNKDDFYYKQVSQFCNEHKDEYLKWKSGELSDNEINDIKYKCKLWYDLFEIIGGKLMCTDIKVVIKFVELYHDMFKIKDNGDLPEQYQKYINVNSRTYQVAISVITDFLIKLNELEEKYGSLSEINKTEKDVVTGLLTEYQSRMVE